QAQARVGVKGEAARGLRDQELREHAQRVGAEAVAEAGLRQGDREAGGDGRTRPGLAGQPHLGPQRDVPPVRHVAEVRIVAGHDAAHPLEVHLHVAGRREHQAQDRQVEPVARAAGEEVRLGADRVGAGLERDPARGRGGRPLGKERVRLGGGLHGERWMVPARIYARPVVLHPGLPLSADELVKILNGLRYEQKDDIPDAPGEFVVGARTVVFNPRPVADAPGEAVAVTFEKKAIRDMRGLSSKRMYPVVTLEPELITYLFDDSREKKRIIKYEELPDPLVKAVLAIEDRRFFSHPGLDPIRIVAAAVRNARAESYIQGGSTITQQLVKNFFLTPERTMRRKLQEVLLAFVLERRADKKDILALYLNDVYLGPVGSFSLHGVGEGARMY